MQKESDRKYKENLLIIFVCVYTCIGLYALMFGDWSGTSLFLFFLFLALGNGTVAHRYFAHKAFKVSIFVHPILVVWATLTAYSPLAYWIVQHRHHHNYTDMTEDTHSPYNGFFHSFFLWTIDKKIIKSIFNIRANVLAYASIRKDPWIRFFDNHYMIVNILFITSLYFINSRLMIAYFAAFCLEQIRLGILNTVHHMPRFPLNYQNHNLENDKSQNNYITGLLTLGFGWHNNHHHDPSKLIQSEKWWELDIEGLVGWLLSLSSGSRR